MIFNNSENSMPIYGTGHGTKTTEIRQRNGDVRVVCYENGIPIKETVCPTLEFAEKYAYNFEKGLVFLG